MGSASAALSGHLGQAQPGQDVLHDAAGPPPFGPEFRGDQQVVADAQPAEQFQPLERPGQPVPGPAGRAHPRDVGAVQEHLPG